MRGREHSFFCNLGLGILLTMKKKLAATDWLIDQVVYRLYALTEKEIALAARRRGNGCKAGFQRPECHISYAESRLRSLQMAVKI